MRVRSVGLLAVVALVVASCGGGVPEAAGPSEGIQVHGDWTIDIYDEDGTLDKHVEFSNAFLGEEVLADLLSLADTMTGWFIQVSSDICDTPSGSCGIVATSLRDPVTNELVVEGSFSPDFDGDVTNVVAKIVSSTLGSRNFSGKNLVLDGPGAERVEAGQTVQVEIRYSFGTAP